MATTYTIAQLDAMKKSKVYDISKKPGGGILVMRTQMIDFDRLATNSGTAVALSDTYQAINVYPGEVVLAAGIINLVATTGAAVYDLGFTGSVVDHFVDGQVANDVTDPTCTDKGFDAPFYCVTQDTIDVLESGAAASTAGGKIMVWALISKMHLGNTATSTRRGRPYA